MTVTVKDQRFAQAYKSTRELSATLTMNQLQQVVPSAFARRPASTTSDRYQYIPTSEAIQGLIDVGFQAVRAGESTTRIDERRGFTRHMVVFRHRDQGLVGGEMIPEVVLLNSHDGTSAYQLYAGMFRVICQNGLIAVEGQFACVRIPHMGRDIVDAVIDGSTTVVRRLPDVLAQVDTWRATRWERPQMEAYAGEALRLRWPDPAEAPIGVMDLLASRRREDDPPTAWHTFNRVQEHLLKGKDSYWREGRRNRTRPVKAITPAMQINTRLWALTQQYVSGQPQIIEHEA